MSKGSKRRPENTAAVEANWPFPERKRGECERCDGSGLVPRLSPDDDDGGAVNRVCPACGGPE